ncbi:hypothetical protein RHSIM_Rhsim04G0210100 [Rhododendron simsii]|uniref:Uncharacterized protein n=1 Tax=Rhododendron simsii TaxID=118357 RepID=A0A834LSY7_RHOSS|nr:hypothetical protein RHSIM_Rhsim04G0210100 [Rhododendron simsii]
MAWCYSTSLIRARYFNLAPAISSSFPSLLPSICHLPREVSSPSRFPAQSFFLFSLYTLGLWRFFIILNINKFRLLSPHLLFDGKTTHLPHAHTPFCLSDHRLQCRRYIQLSEKVASDSSCSATRNIDLILDLELKTELFCLAFSLCS